MTRSPAVRSLRRRCPVEDRGAASPEGSRRPARSRSRPRPVPRHQEPPGARADEPAQGLAEPPRGGRAGRRVEHRHRERLDQAVHDGTLSDDGGHRPVLRREDEPQDARQIAQTSSPCGRRDGSSQDQGERPTRRIAPVRPIDRRAAPRAPARSSARGRRSSSRRSSARAVRR